MAPGSILMLALGRLEGPGWAPGPVMQLCIPNSTAQTQLLLLHPESRGCCSRGTSAELPPALPDSGSAFPASHSISITFPGGDGCGQDHISTNSSLIESSQREQSQHEDPVLRPNLWGVLGSAWQFCSPCSAYPTISFQCSLLISYFTLGEPYLEKSFQALSRSRLCSEGVGTPGTSPVTSSWSSEAQKTLKPRLSGAWWEFLSQQPLAWRWQRGGGGGSFQGITVG